MPPTKAAMSQGTAYPAFRVPVQSALTALANWGYQIRVGEQFVTPQQAVQTGSNLFRSMVLSPTNTGIFIQIRSTLTPDQLKQLKANRGMTKTAK